MNGVCITVNTMLQGFHSSCSFSSDTEQREERRHPQVHVSLMDKAFFFSFLLIMVNVFKSRWLFSASVYHQYKHSTLGMVIQNVMEIPHTFAGK